MVYVDSSGVTHVSLDEVKSGYAAKTTASRSTSGAIVGDSTGSRYVRQQEAQKEQAQQTQQAAQQQATQQMQSIQQTQQQAGFLYPSFTRNEVLQQQIKAVEQERPQQQGLLTRMKTAASEGFAAGEGNNYSLMGLTAPQTQAKDLYTYPIHEKASNLSKKYDTLQNSVLSGFPSGTTKNFITGVTNVPEIAINTLGSIPMGTEAIIRNKKSSPETVSLGLGAMAGATYKKAQTNPAELTGEIVGSYGLGKASGSLYSKVTPKQVKEVPITQTERQFSVLEGMEKTKIDILGSPREYLKLKTRVAGENELNPFDVKKASDLLSQNSRTFNVKYTQTRSTTDFNLNTEIKAAEGTGQIKLTRPSIVQAEQKTLFGDTVVKVDKGNWNVDLTGLPLNKFSYKKRYGVENYLGKETFDYDFSTVVENTRIRPINEISPAKETVKNPLPEGAELYFDVPKAPKQTSLFDDFGSSDSIPIVKARTRNLLPGEKPGFYAYEKNRVNKLAGIEENSTIEKGAPGEKTGNVLREENKIQLTPSFSKKLDKISKLSEEDLKIYESLKETAKASDISIEVKGNKGNSSEASALQTSNNPAALLKVKEPKTALREWKKDIIFEELQPKIITSVKSFEIPNTYSPLWGWSGAGLSIATQPFLTQIGEPTFNPSKGSIWALNAPKIDINLDIQEKSGIGLKSSSLTTPGIKQDIRVDIIPDIKQDIIPDIRQDIEPDIFPDIKPEIKPIIDPIINPIIDPINKPIIDPIVSPINNPIIEPITEPVINPNIIIPIGGGDWDFYRVLNDSPQKRKRTKNKILKNIYGDPFKLKVDIRL